MGSRHLHYAISTSGLILSGVPIKFCGVCGSSGPQRIGPGIILPLIKPKRGEVAGLSGIYTSFARWDKTTLLITLNHTVRDRENAEEHAAMMSWDAKNGALRVVADKVVP